MCGTRTMVTGAFLEIKTNSYQENGEMIRFKVDKSCMFRYENGCLTPDMGSVFIALDPAVKENGCLQVKSFLCLLVKYLDRFRSDRIGDIHK